MSSSPVPVCQDGTNPFYWKNILVVKPSASFDPIAWYKQDGLHTPAVQSYLKTQLLTGVSVSMALLGMVLLFTLLFLLWRLVRCCKCCPPDHAHINPLAELKDPWLHAQQALVVVAAVASIALAIWGMVQLPRHPFADLSSQAENVLQYASGVLDQVDVALDTVRNINTSVNGVQDMVEYDVNAPYILQQMKVLEPLVYGLPDPVPLKDAITMLDIHINGLTPMLNTMMALVKNVSLDLIPAITQAAELVPLLDTINAAVGFYIDHAGKLLGSNFGGPEAYWNVGTMIDSQSRMTISVWVDTIDRTLAALTELQTSKAIGLLPGIQTGAAAILDQSEPILQKMTLVQAELATLCALYPSDAVRAALPSLEMRLRHINTTVVLLDTETTKTYQMILLANSSISSLYPPGGIASTPMCKDADQASVIVTQIRDAVDKGNALKDTVQRPSELLASVSETDLTALGLLLGALRQQLTLAGPVIEDVDSAITAFRAEETEAAYDNLLTAVRTANVSVLTPMWDGLSSIKQDDSSLYLATAVAMNASVPVMTDTAAQAQVALQTSKTQVESYQQDITTQINSGLKTLTQLVSVLPTPRSQVFDGPANLLNSAVSQAENGIRGVRQDVQSAVDQVAYQVADMRDTHLPKAMDLKDSSVDTLEHYWTYIYNGLMGGFGAVILLCLVLACVVLFKNPAGVMITSVLLLVGLLAWLGTSLFTMGAMVVLQDACENAEQIIVNQLSGTTRGLLLSQFYLNRQAEDVGGIKAVLKEANVVDVDKVLDDMTDSQNELLNNLQATWQVQPALSNQLLAVTDSVEAAQLQIHSVVALISLGPVRGLYVSLKSEVCCSLGAQLMVIWICITGSGLLAWVAVVCAKFVLGRLDYLPKHGCLGCQCYKVSDYQGLPRPSKRRFWDSWGGSSNITSGGGATSLASVATSSIITTNDLNIKPLHGPLSVRVPRSGNESGAGSSSAGTSAGGGNITNPVAVPLPYPYKAITKDLEMSQKEGKALVPPHTQVINIQLNSSKSLSQVPSSPAPLESVPSAPMLPATEAVSMSGTPAAEIEPHTRNSAAEGEAALSTPGSSSLGQLFSWLTPPVNVNRVNSTQLQGQQDMQDTTPHSVQWAPPGSVPSSNTPEGAQASAAPPPAVLPSPRAAVSIVVLDQETAEAVEKQQLRL